MTSLRDKIVTRAGLSERKSSLSDTCKRSSGSAPYPTSCLEHWLQQDNTSFLSAAAMTHDRAAFDSLKTCQAVKLSISTTRKRGAANSFGWSTQACMNPADHNRAPEARLPQDALAPTLSLSEWLRQSTALLSKAATSSLVHDERMCSW